MEILFMFLAVFTGLTALLFLCFGLRGSENENDAMHCFLLFGVLAGSGTALLGTAEKFGGSWWWLWIPTGLFAAVAGALSSEENMRKIEAAAFGVVIYALLILVKPLYDFRYWEFAACLVVTAVAIAWQIAPAQDAFDRAMISHGER